MNKSTPLLMEAIGLHQRGAVGEAAARYSAILKSDPKNVDALFFLGVAAGQQGRFREAAKTLRKTVRVAPKHAQAHLHLGMAQTQLGEADEALQSFERAALSQPTLIDAHLHCGNALAARDRHAEAIECFDRALALQGDLPELWVNRGNALRALDRFADALESYDRAIAIKPDFAEAHYSIGLTHEDQCRHDLALPCFDRAIALRAFGGDPRRQAQAHLRRAVALHVLGRFAEGLADAEQAMRLAPADDEVLYTISFIDRLHGRWLEAWPKHERRAAFRLATPAALANRPMWRGEPMGHETLLIRGEEGLGDQIQFCRYVPHLAERGFRVAVWPDKKLVPLFATARGIEKVVSDESEIAKLGRLRWLHVLSLPHILRTTPDTIPPTVPYLAADPARVAAWRDRLGAGFKIGIHWQGNPRMVQDRIRSMPLTAFAPLADIPGTRLISLQKMPGARQIAETEFRARIETPLDDADIGPSAILDTAAVLMNLDLVVTSDSMIPHLAGALGRPVFLALMHVPDWRWQLSGEDSPWYPSMRVFRQPAPGDWTDVFRRIAQAVRTLGRG